MPKTAGSLALASYEDIFQSTLTPVIQDGERIVHIPLEQLYPPEFHPFQVRDDPAMQRLVKSIRKSGVHTPGIIRARELGGYELLAGNRRKRASELAGLSTLPAVIREVDDDVAALIIVDTNLEQRESFLPSEKAWA